MTLAALCHDLGHGPYSHLFDRDFIKNRLGMNWKHEKGSITMFEDLLKKNSITMKSINLEDEDKEFIKALIKVKDLITYLILSTMRKILLMLTNLIILHETVIIQERNDYLIFHD